MTTYQGWFFSNSTTSFTKKDLWWEGLACHRDHNITMCRGRDFSKKKEISEKESVNCQPMNYCCPWSTVITAKRWLTVPLVNSSKHVFFKLISLTCTTPLPGGLASSKWSNILIGEMKDKREGEERETIKIININ